MQTINIVLNLDGIENLNEPLVIHVGGNTSTKSVELQQYTSGFIHYIDTIVHSLKQNGQARTAETYWAAALSLKKYIKEEDLAFENIDDKLLIAYENYLKEQGISLNTSSFYMRKLRAAYNRAVDEGLIADYRPFKKVYTGIARTEKRAITIEQMRRIKHLVLNEPQLNLARNMFLFSFYTRGMSFIDMAYLSRKDLKDGLLIYRRKKTGQCIAIRWDNRIQELLERIGIGSGEYLLPIIRNKNGHERSQIRASQYEINCNLKTIAQKAGIRTNLTMYVARHTWASIALSLNVPVNIISQGMGHDSEKTTRIYLKTLDMSELDCASSRILDAIYKESLP